MIERTSGTHPRCLSYGGTVIIQQPHYHGFLLPIPSKQERERERERARSIQPNFPEISVQNSMDRFGPIGKVSKERVHLLRWSSFPGRTGWNFGWMDHAQRDPGWVWSHVSRTKFILREEAAILCAHPSPRRSSCLQAKGSTFISQPWLLVWPCESKYWPPTLQSSAQLTELILPWLRKALHPKNSPKVQLRHFPNHTKTSKWPVVSCTQSTLPTDKNGLQGCIQQQSEYIFSNFWMPHNTLI